MARNRQGWSSGCWAGAPTAVLRTRSHEITTASAIMDRRIPMAKRIPAVNQRGLAAAPEWCRARSRTGEPVSESETHFTQHNQDLQ
jgi:hypothetical protein